MTNRPDTMRRHGRLRAETRFRKGVLKAESAGEPDQLLLRIVAEPPEEERSRAPLDLALVLDRSGSMRGAPIEAAKHAAHDAVDLLEDGDRIAVVVYDSDVDVLVPTTRLGSDRDAVHHAIDRIAHRGMTALHAGWTEGAAQLVDLLEPGRAARVVLLTDGLANRGVTDPAAIARDVAAMRQHGITTSAVGLGRSFAEDLLATIADAGGGRFAFAETATDLEGVMAAELIGIDVTAARDVRADLRIDRSRLKVGGPLNGFMLERGLWALPDIVQELPLDVVFEFGIGSQRVGADPDLGSIQLSWTDDGGQSCTLDVPVRAEVVDADRYAATPDDPDVASAVAALTAARDRREAMEALDRGDMNAARRRLEAIELALRSAPDTQAVRREQASLRQVHEALDQRDGAMARKRMAIHQEQRRKGFDSDMLSSSSGFARRSQARDARRTEREGRRGPKGPADHDGFDSSGPGSLGTAGASVATGSSGSARASTDAWRRVEVRRRDGTTGVLRLRTGDITEWRGDAIVNPTNPEMHGTGASVDGAVHRNGGMELTRECRTIGHVALGEAVVTKGWALPAGYVLHTAVPVSDGSDRAFEALRSCYRSALSLARQLRLRRIAFPAIGTGTNGFPLAPAAEIGLREIMDALSAEGGPERVEVVLYDASTRKAYGQLLRTLARERGLGADAA